MQHLISSQVFSYYLMQEQLVITKELNTNRILHMLLPPSRFDASRIYSNYSLRLAFHESEVQKRCNISPLGPGNTTLKCLYSIKGNKVKPNVRQ